MPCVRQASSSENVHLSLIRWICHCLCCVCVKELAELRKKRMMRNPSYAHIFPQDKW